MRGAWSAQPGNEPGKARIHTSSRRSRTTCTPETPPCTWRRQPTDARSRKLLSTRAPTASPRTAAGAAAALRGGCQCRQSGRASGHHRLPDRGRRRSKRNGQQRRHAVAPRGPHAMRGSSRSVAGRRRGAAGQKRKRLDAASSRRSEHRRSNSGTPHAIMQQRLIIDLLLRAGATPDDRDENGKAVFEAASADWIRALL